MNAPHQPGDIIYLDDGQRDVGDLPQYRVDDVRPLAWGGYALDLTNLETKEEFLASSFDGQSIGGLMEKDMKEFGQPTDHRITAGKL